MALAQQAGNLLGQMLLEGLSGNPQQEAEQLAQEEARRAELQRIAEEQARHMEETKNRLLSMMLGVGPANDLQPLGVGPSTDLKPLGMDSGTDLQPMLGDNTPVRSPTLADIPASSAMAQLTSAAYYSDLAAKAPSEEDAVVLADAAFNMTLGIPVNLPVPSATRALPVQDTDMSRIEATRNQYRDASNTTDASQAKIAELEQQRLHVQQVMQGKEANLSAEDRKAANGQATALLAKLDRQLAEARTNANTSQAKVSASAGGLLDLLDYLRHRNSIGPPPEHQPEKDAYLRGIEDGALCCSSDGSRYCKGDPACMQNYDNGYHVGERWKENKLREAYRIGQEARQKNDVLIGFNHPKSVGPCRSVWLNVFSSGWHGTPFTMIGR